MKKWILSVAILAVALLCVAIAPASDMQREQVFLGIDQMTGSVQLGGPQKCPVNPCPQAWPFYSPSLDGGDGVAICDLYTQNATYWRVVQAPVGFELVPIGVVRTPQRCRPYYP